MMIHLLLFCFLIYDWYQLKTKSSIKALPWWIGLIFMLPERKLDIALLIYAAWVDYQLHAISDRLILSYALTRFIFCRSFPYNLIICFPLFILSIQKKVGWGDSLIFAIMALTMKAEQFLMICLLSCLYPLIHHSIKKQARELAWIPYISLAYLTTEYTKLIINQR